MNPEQLKQAAYALSIPPLIIKSLKEELLTAYESIELEKWKEKNGDNRLYFEYLLNTCILNTC